MESSRSLLQKKVAVLPVIHAVDISQALRNIAVALSVESDGVFLINHEISSSKLFEIYESAIKQFPGAWIGLNCLGFGPEEIFNEVSRPIFSNLSGIWVDNAMIDESLETQEEAIKIDNIRRASGYNSVYFGGVAFKHQPIVDELEKAASIAAKYMDVVTTSGPTTGEPPEVEKIKRMKSAIGDKPLAIASGITPENVHNYLGIANYFLVATGISENFTTLSYQRLKSLIENLKR